MWHVCQVRACSLWRHIVHAVLVKLAQGRVFADIVPLDLEGVLVCHCHRKHASEGMTECGQKRTGSNVCYQNTEGSANLLNGIRK
jgi:hypothetical protein